MGAGAYGEYALGLGCVRSLEVDAQTDWRWRVRSVELWVDLASTESALWPLRECALALERVVSANLDLQLLLQCFQPRIPLLNPKALRLIVSNKREIISAIQKLSKLEIQSCAHSWVKDSKPRQIHDSLASVEQSLIYVDLDPEQMDSILSDLIGLGLKWAKFHVLKGWN